MSHSDITKTLIITDIQVIWFSILYTYMCVYVSMCLCTHMCV